MQASTARGLLYSVAMARTWRCELGLALCCSCYTGLDGTSAEEGGGDTQGDGSDAGGDDTGDAVPPVDADALGPSDLRMLSDWEYANTLGDLFGAEVRTELGTILGSIPTSRVDGGYSTMDRRLSAGHVDAHYAVAIAVAELVSRDPARRAALAPCLLDRDDDECGGAFIDAFGPRVYRGRLDGDERARLLAAWSADTLEARVENVVLHALMSPRFLYRPELAGEDLGGRVQALGGHEVASRLSYLLWGTMPDAELFAAADADALGDAEGIRVQAERMLDDPRARAGIARFAVEWLRLLERPGLGFSERFLDGLDTTGLRADIIAELPRLFEHLVFEDAGRFADLFTTRLGFVTTPGLATIYGVGLPGAEVSDGPIALSDDRGGLLTRAAILLGTGDETHPLVRGAFVVKRLLCHELTPPPLPPDALEPPPFDPNASNRQRWSEKTDSGSCAGCHQLINPSGFAAEGYDAIGRARTEEDVIDPAGEVVNTLPVDTRVSVIIDGDTHDVADLVELGAILADSDEASRCFATQLFRYGNGRREADEDASSIDALVPGERTLRDLLLAFVTAPEFRTVKLAD
jgi:hypothetical protein